MIRNAIRWADLLDSWLKEHVGRLYNTILLVGLITSVGATITAIQHALGEATALDVKSVSAFAITLVFQAGLLVNQLAQLHHYREDRRARREEAKARKAASGGA